MIIIFWIVEPYTIELIRTKKMKNTTNTTKNNEIKLYSTYEDREDKLKEISSFLNAVKSYKVADLTTSELQLLYNTCVTDLTSIDAFLEDLKDVKKYIKDATEKDNAIQLQTRLKDIKRDINAFNNNSKQLVEKFNNLDKKLSLSYVKLRNYNLWETPISQINNDTFEVQGFSKNCRVYVRFKQNSLPIVYVLPLAFKSKKQESHFFKLCLENEDTVIKEAKAWLNKVKTVNDMLNIIAVQQAIKAEKEAIAQARKFNKCMELKDSYKVFKDAMRAERKNK